MYNTSSLSHRTGQNILQITNTTRSQKAWATVSDGASGGAGGGGGAPPAGVRPSPPQKMELKLVCGYTCSYDTTSRWPRAVARGAVHGMDSTVHVMVVLFMGHVMALVHVMVVLFMGMSLETLFTHKTVKRITDMVYTTKGKSRSRSAHKLSSCPRSRSTLSSNMMQTCYQCMIFEPV
jgi:hypothetical protein